MVNLCTIPSHVMSNTYFNLQKELTYLQEEMKQKQKEFSEELAKLNSDVTEKDEMIRQCIKDKESLEEEKNVRSIFVIQGRY